MRSVLNISSSVLQAKWMMPEVNDNQVQELMLHHKLPEIVARLLASRNIALNEVDGFLNPTLAKDFPNPLKLKDMEDCVNFIAAQIIAEKKFGALCDFDVDGATSAALLIKFFRHLGLPLPLHIPDRINEGYGPNSAALLKLKNQGVDVVFIVDCGTTAFAPIEYARDIGLDVIVLDHHEPSTTLPNVTYIINPKRADDESELSMLAACGVTFFTLVALNSALRAQGFYASKNIPEVPLKKFLDLVALGTVCDMVPLKGVNRLLVKAGFEQMALQQNIGLKALCTVGNIKKPPTPMDAGFVLGPRINAGSRVHLSDLGAKLLASDDAEEANNLAWHLNDCNVKRRSLQAEMLKEAIFQVERFGLADRPLIMVSDPSWHVGLNGLVAGQLKERYGKPACVIAFANGMNEALEGRGSGRSVKGFNLAALFMRALDKNLLLKGGGHAMAAGFTVLPEQIDALYNFFLEEAAHLSEQEILIEERVDGLMSLSGLKPEFIHILEKNIGPFGQENPEPRFVIPSTKIIMADIVGDKHVRVQVADEVSGTRMKGIAFSAVETPLGELLLSNKGSGRTLHLMGQFKVNEWNGSENVEFHILDAA